LKGVRLPLDNFSINQGIPAVSPFCKGGLRGIFPISPELFERLHPWGGLKTRPYMFYGKILILLMYGIAE